MASRIFGGLRVPECHVEAAIAVVDGEGCQGVPDDDALDLYGQDLGRELA
jgi:hypothetical protein